MDSKPTREPLSEREGVSPGTTVGRSSGLPRLSGKEGDVDKDLPTPPVPRAVSKRSSAQGSEAMSWQVWPYGKTCHTCGKTLRIQDVGEHRTVYDKGKAVAWYLWCKDHRGGRA